MIGNYSVRPEDDPVFGRTYVVHDNRTGEDFGYAGSFYGAIEMIHDDATTCAECGGKLEPRGGKYGPKAREHMLEVYECQQCEHSVHPALVEGEVK